MKEITTTLLLSELGYQKKYGFRMAVTILGGFFFILLIAVYIATGMAFWFLMGLTLMLTFFLGVRPLRKLVNTKNCIETGNVRVIRDTVTAKKQLSGRYLLSLKEYTKRTETSYRAPKAVYDIATKGMDFYLIYAGDEAMPIGVYPVECYVLDNIIAKGAGESSLERITPQLILTELRSARTIVARALTTLLGVGLTLLPIPYTLGRPRDMLLSILVMGLIFGTLFGILFGLKPLISSCLVAYRVKSGKISIVKDAVSDKQYRDLNDRRRCLLMFRDYSERTQKGIFRDDKEYKKVAVGDEFYLVYAKKGAEPLCIFSAKKYCI